MEAWLMIDGAHVSQLNFYRQISTRKIGEKTDRIDPQMAKND